jgi:lysyl-tRNA synthetase class 1
MPPSPGEQWQAHIFSLAQVHGLSAAEAFRAIYLAFLGRVSGPRAGWLLASLDSEFVLRRLAEASEQGTLVV